VCGKQMPFMQILALKTPANAFEKARRKIRFSFGFFKRAFSAGLFCEIFLRADFVVA
jgi:hypothetical protein